MTDQLSLFSFNTPSMPKLDISRCYTKPINYETAANMVQKYHYAHRVPSISFAVGMYVDSVLAGCITFNTVFANIASAICGPQYSDFVFELARLFIHDWSGRNSESWFIGESFKWLRRERPDILILLSYADTNRNHLGLVYQATNWVYTGISPSATGREYVINGKVKTRRDFRRSAGSNEIMSFTELQEIYPDIKKVESSEKHRYVYFLGNRRQRRELRKALKWPVLPYPKREKND